jgi:glycosyltransferase involved in cell wall biosynthesis
MIVKNEEAVIGRCLESVKDLVDEIIVADTGSTDKTKKIVSNYTDKIYDFRWIDDFAAARNFAFGKATMSHIFWLDADDIIPDAGRASFVLLKRQLDPKVDSVTMQYHLAYDDNGQATISLRRNRLVKRSRAFRWIGAVHEYLEVSGVIINSDIAVKHCNIYHDSQRNLQIYEKRLAKGEVFSARDLYYYANELLDHGRQKEAIVYYRKFLNTKAGWVEDNIAACCKLADCFLAIKDTENYLGSLYQAFNYDVPRAEVCCCLGFFHLEQEQFRQAIFWYELATKLTMPADSWGMINRSCWTWLPHLQLCVCYDRIGDYDMAAKQNELAAGFIPDDKRIAYNREYFKKYSVK